MTRHSAAAVLSVLTLVLVPVAVAGHGESHGGKPGAGKGAAITFDPSAVVVGQAYRVNGTGFRPNTWVTVGAYYADTTWWNSQVSDDQGNVSLSFTATHAGEVVHEAKQQGNNGRLRLVASATLPVSASE